MIRRRKSQEVCVSIQTQVIEHPAIAYLDGLFEEGDNIFFQLIHSTKKYTPINKKTGQPLLDSNGQPRLLAETKLLPLISVDKAATSEFINSLLGYEALGWNIYLCMNPFPEGTTTRTETLVQNIRNIFLDVDKTKVNGDHALKLIAEAVKAGLIPPPTSILESSPGNYHVVWCVDDFRWDEAKAILPVLASKLGGDLSAIDVHRVLRMPGFKNLKPEREGFVCQLLEGVKNHLGEEPYTKSQFKCPIVVETREKTEASPEAVQNIVEYIYKNAAEAQFELGPEDERSDGGVNWIIDCPWAAGHTTGQNTAMLMVLADGRPQFNCFHGHCNGVDGPKRGWSDIRKLWEEKVGHKQQFADVAEVYTNTTNPNPATKAASTAAPSTPPTENDVLIEKFSDDEMELQEWLWEGHIPMGALTLFAGNPDVGKSLAALDLVARGTKGLDYPDGSANDIPPFDVILLEAEDDAKKTVGPRLSVAAEDVGADLSRVMRIKVKLAGGLKTRMLQLDKDIELIEKTIQKHETPIRLLVVSPLSAYLGSTVSAIDDNSVRAVLGPLQDMAARQNVAILAVIHLNKQSDYDVIYRVSGAMGFVAVARASWLFAKDAKDKQGDKRFMMPIKGNLAEKQKGIIYRINVSEKTVQVKDKKTGQMVSTRQPRIYWGETTDVDANDVMRESVGLAKADYFTEAKAWLVNLFKDATGKVTGYTITRDEYVDRLRTTSIPESTLKRARVALGVKWIAATQSYRIDPRSVDPVTPDAQLDALKAEAEQREKEHAVKGAN